MKTIKLELNERELDLISTSVAAKESLAITEEGLSDKEIDKIIKEYTDIIIKTISAKNFLRDSRGESIPDESDKRLNMDDLQLIDAIAATVIEAMNISSAPPSLNDEHEERLTQLRYKIIAEALRLNPSALD